MDTRNQDNGLADEPMANNDPLGLRQLDEVQPDFDGWADIKATLESQKAKGKSWRRPVSWLAAAASLVLVIGLSVRYMQPDQQGEALQNPSITNSATQLATNSGQPASLSMNDATTSENLEPENTLSGSIADADTIASLIGLSNKMQTQVGQMRQQTVSMPAESAMYVAELEDLITQVDNELSYTPDSIDLWGQRVNLLLDLAQIYQQQWQLDYGRMASL